MNFEVWFRLIFYFTYSYTNSEMTDLDWFDFQFQWARGIQSASSEAHSQVYATSGYWHIGSKLEVNSTELSASSFWK